MDDTLAVAADFPDPNSQEAETARIRAYADQLPVDPTLLPLTQDDATIDAPVPEVRAMTEERFQDFAMDAITHVVISVTLSRQAHVLRHVGYQYDWNSPGPSWQLLGKIAAKGVFDDRTKLHNNLTYIPIRRREFIVYTTSTWKAVMEAEGEADRAERPPLSVIEAHFKKPQPGQPLEMTWAPARALIAAQVGRMMDSSEPSDEADLSDKDEIQAQ